MIGQLLDRQFLHYRQTFAIRARDEARIGEEKTNEEIVDDHRIVVLSLEEVEEGGGLLGLKGGDGYAMDLPRSCLNFISYHQIGKITTKIGVRLVNCVG